MLSQRNENPKRHLCFIFSVASIESDTFIFTYSVQLNPTLTHYVLRSFIERGHFHYIVTQNIDSLHLRSGVPSEKQSELHGNYSLETCPLCDARYFRSHAVWKGLTTPTKNPSTARKDLRQGSTQGDDKPQRSNKRQVRNIDHRTGRLCEADGCAGELESSVVLFGESLPAKVYFKPVSSGLTSNQKFVSFFMYLLCNKLSCPAIIVTVIVICISGSELSLGPYIQG